MIQSNSKIYIIIASIITLISAFIIYPHSEIANIAWLLGSYISPGISDSFTGIFVFIYIMLTLIGIFQLSWLISKYIDTFIIGKK